MLMSNVQVSAIFAGMVLVGSAMPAAGAVYINGTYYSDMVGNSCTNNANPVVCLLEFAPTPSTTATVKVQSLSCSWESTSNSGLSSAIFRVANGKGVVLSERYIAKAERDGPATTGTLNVAIANAHVSMTVPKGGRSQVYFTGGVGTLNVKCTIVGTYN